MKDRELWKEIYEKYAKRMLTVCLRYSPGREEAEDFMHDGFMQVFRSLDKFTDRGEGSLRAWIERIMINTCLQSYRKKDVFRNSKPVETVPDTEGDPLPGDSFPGDSFLNEATERISLDVLQRFIRDLPPGYRTVFNLYVFEGLSHREIAQQLGIQERSSSSQFYRAKCLLARLIKDYESKQR